VIVRELQGARRFAVRDALQSPREAVRLRGESESANRDLVESIEKGAHERAGGRPSVAICRT